MDRPDPRDKLSSEWPEVKLYARWMPDRWALTTWTDAGPIIELAVDLGPEQQAATLAHEIMHLELGAPCRSFCDANEREAVAMTARYLLPDLDRLGELLGRGDVRTAAAQLGVPSDIVLDRLAHLTPAETDTISTHLKTVRAEPAGNMAAHRRTAPPQHHCKKRSHLCEPQSSSPQVPPA